MKPPKVTTQFIGTSNAAGCESWGRQFSEPPLMQTFQGLPFRYTNNALGLTRTTAANIPGSLQSILDANTPPFHWYRQMLSNWNLANESIQFAACPASAPGYHGANYICTWWVYAQERTTFINPNYPPGSYIFASMTMVRPLASMMFTAVDCDLIWPDATDYNGTFNTATIANLTIIEEIGGTADTDYYIPFPDGGQITPAQLGYGRMRLLVPNLTGYEVLFP